MFRKSVAFFILLALFWLLMWVYIPDFTPNKLSISDFFRGFLLLFSLAALGFSLLFIIIRYKGVDIVTSFFPHAGVVMWLGKHAYQYAQPSTLLDVTYQGNAQHIALHIELAARTIKEQLKINKTKTINLGHLNKNPMLIWHPTGQLKQQHELEVIEKLARFGKQQTIKAIIEDDAMSFVLLNE